MKISKAIEIHNDLPLNDRHIFSPDQADAIKLGKEALKLISQEPPEGYTCIPRPLPGETPEEAVSD